MTPHGILIFRFVLRSFAQLSLRYAPQGLRRSCARLICGFLLSSVLGANVSASEARPLRLFEHFRDCNICSEMVVIPAGKFMMGATDAEYKNHEQYMYSYRLETPRHEVHVKSFAIGKFDVTRGQFAEFARETNFDGRGCRIFNGSSWIFSRYASWENPGFTQTNNDPVVCVSWDDAQKFIAWLNHKAARYGHASYRLPTEEEWEYAARAGTTTATYWGDEAFQQCKHENARDLSTARLNPDVPNAKCDDGFVTTSPVGSFEPNPWVLYDMLGDAYQWVSDCSHVGYSTNPSQSPLSAIDCSMREARGASWATIPFDVRSASRIAEKTSARRSVIGFRLTVDLRN